MKEAKWKQRKMNGENKEGCREANENNEWGKGKVKKKRIECLGRCVSVVKNDSRAESGSLPERRRRTHIQSQLEQDSQRHDQSLLSRARAQYR